MRFAYNGVTSSRQAMRASAIEFLDNLMSARLKRAVLPVLVAGGLRAPAARERDDHLRRILTGSDSWLIACALDAVRELGLGAFEAEVAAQQASRDPIVREAAALALGGS